MRNVLGAPGAAEGAQSLLARSRGDGAGVGEGRLCVVSCGKGVDEVGGEGGVALQLGLGLGLSLDLGVSLSAGAGFSRCCCWCIGGLEQRWWRGRWGPPDICGCCFRCHVTKTNVLSVLTIKGKS